jgi:hypothetical protein
MLSAIYKPYMLSVIMLNVIMLSAIMLNVVVPWPGHIALKLLASLGSTVAEHSPRHPKVKGLRLAIAVDIGREQLGRR